MTGMIIEENIGKKVLFQGEQSEIVGYAGNRYKLSDGSFATHDQVEFVGEINEPPVDQDVVEPRKDDQEISADILAAIASVPKSRYSRKTGKPGLKAVSEALGRDLDKEELEQAWAQYQNL